MKKMFLTFLAGAALIAGCGDDKKDDKQTRSYLITRENAVSVTRLGMQVAAIAGRHAVIAPGSSTAPRECPFGDTEGTISIVPNCMPDFENPMEVSCDITETYDCSALSGTIDNQTDLTADGTSTALEAADYREGNETIGFINYNGSISIATNADGTSRYQEALSVNALTADGVTRQLTSTSDVTVSTNASNAVLDGGVDLNIVGMGIGRLDLQGMEFDPTCAASPVNGVMDLALVGLERAQLVFEGCGTVTLYHFDGNTRTDPEQFTGDELATAFASAVSDITSFANVASNVEPAAESVENNRFCSPIIPGTTPVLATYVSAPTTFTLPSTTNPMAECLSFPAGATTFAHLVWEDKTGTGLFGDPTQIQVHFFRAGVYAEDAAAAGGKDVLVYAQALTQATTYAALEPTPEGAPTKGVTPFCNPAVTTPGAGFCTGRVAFDGSFDHLALRMTGVANVGSGTPVAVPTPFWLVHILD
jgi:hypothetical protein